MFFGSAHEKICLKLDALYIMFKKANERQF